MYEWSLAEEQVELWRSEQERLREVERQRAEIIGEWEEGHPSLVSRFIKIFRARPEPLIARNRIEVDLLAAMRADARRDVK